MLSFFQRNMICFPSCCSLIINTGSFFCDILLVLFQNSEFHPSTTVHVDSFLYNDEDIDRLCDEGKMSRNYCKDCGSHNTAPLSKKCIII